MSEPTTLDIKSTPASPCPFCAGIGPTPMELAVDTYAYVCQGCGIIGPAMDTPSHALEAWNTRGKSVAALADAETCIVAGVLEGAAAKLYRNELGPRDGAVILLYDSKSKHLAANVHRLDEAGVKWIIQAFAQTLGRSPAGLIIPGR
jgi:hypothetical protein